LKSVTNTRAARAHRVPTLNPHASLGFGVCHRAKSSGEATLNFKGED
jgi:hypothetical protein